MVPVTPTCQPTLPVAPCGPDGPSAPIFTNAVYGVANPEAV